MNKQKINLAVIIILGSVCLIIALATMRIKTNTIREHKKMVNQWNTDLVNLKVVPTAKNIFLMQDESKWLINAEKDLKQTLSEKKISYTELTPLQFKEELLDMQTKMKQLADIQSCKLQEDLGFPEFSAGGIPEAKNVSVLAKQLKVISELVNLLLKNKITEINSISRYPQIYYSENNLYKELTFHVNIQCTVEDLLRVLADIANIPYLLIVRNMKIENLGENKINVEMLIGEAEFV